MSIKNTIKIFTIIVGIFLLFSLVGCKSAGTDETQITQIAKNIEEAIEEKDVDLFMENISYNYSDSDGGTYDNHINGLPEEIFSKIEDAEDLVDAFSILKIEIKVTIPESDLIIIKISLEACILWVVCTDLYNENIEYNVDFIKEEDNWKIISMVKI